MENHPIPQDVTSFQFKLIGEMTIKQFAYLAAGLILAWICFALPLAFLIKLPFMILFGLVGVVLAFIPVEGRPADLMLFHFFRALFAPNQYMFQKSGETRIPTTMYSQTPPIVTQSSPQAVQPHPQAQIIPKPSPIIEPTIVAPILQTKPMTPTAQPVLPQPMPVQPPPNIEPHTLPAPPILTNTAKENNSPIPTPPMQPKPAPPVQIPSKQTPNSVGMPLTPEVANLITGVVKDPRGNVLPNMLVEVKDKDDNPVRAFKTNALGQFVSATPLLNGEYTVSFEDPAGKQLFDPVNIVIKGEIIQPLLIMSRDAREELRKELFGK